MKSNSLELSNSNDEKGRKVYLIQLSARTNQLSNGFTSIVASSLYNDNETSLKLLIRDAGKLQLGTT